VPTEPQNAAVMAVEQRLERGLGPAADVLDEPLVGSEAQ
jgi:hypothetical protein